MDYWIAIVDDEPIYLKNTKKQLTRNNMRVSCMESGQELLTFMEDNTPDLILLDVLMPKMDGFETYNRLRYLEDKLGHRRTPVIFLTSESTTEREQRGLVMGAADYIHKPIDEAVVVRRIINSINNQKTIDTLKEEAYKDKLTGFYNKDSGTHRITDRIIFSTGAMIMIDLDNFKLVNDLFGHEMGDSVLAAFADILREHTDETDIVARIGGDEFLGFFSGIKSETAVASLTIKLNEKITDEAAKLLGEDHGIPIGVSMGVVMINDGYVDFNKVFSHADNAMYIVKNNGKHGYEIYRPEVTDDMDTDDLDNELLRAMQIISERGKNKGALLLGQEAFSWSYRYIERFLSRSGGVVTRILFSLESGEDDNLDFFDKVSEFGNILKDNLRKSDIILHWHKAQYIAVLPLLHEEDVSEITDRIIEIWEGSGYSDGIEIKYASSTIIQE